LHHGCPGWDTGPVPQHYFKDDWSETADDDFMTDPQNQQEEDDSATSLQRASTNREEHNYEKHDDDSSDDDFEGDDEKLATSAKESGKVRLLKSLFPSNRSPADDMPHTESRQSADRGVISRPGLQRPRAEDQRSSPQTSGVELDTNRDDSLSRQRAIPKHRKRILPDEPLLIAQNELQSEFPRRGKIRRRHHRKYFQSNQPLLVAPAERQAEFPGRGKIRRRHQHVSSRRGDKHIEQGRRRAVSSIDVVIRPVDTRQRRFSRHRHVRGRHRARRAGVILINRQRRRGRQASELHPRTLDFIRSSNLTHRNQSSSDLLTSRTFSHSVDSTSTTSDAALDETKVEPTAVDISLPNRTHRWWSVSRLLRRVLREVVDKQRQRLILEKLLEATMTQPERAARNLTSSRLDQLLGKSDDNSSTGTKYNASFTYNSAGFTS